MGYLPILMTLSQVHSGEGKIFGKCGLVIFVVNSANSFNDGFFMQLCPCGTGKDYFECCGIFIQGQKTAPTPEALMRSRYSAYTKANRDYIRRTMKAPASDRFCQSNFKMSYFEQY